MTERAIKLAEVPVDEEVETALLSVLRSGRYVRGPESQAFGSEFAKFCGARFGETIANGTAAVHASLMALGVGPGDEVIVPSFTFIATVNPVVMLGATPIFADIDPKTFCLDPDQVRARISPRTKAIVPVHLYGHPAVLDTLLELAAPRGIPVVEDACQAHGAEIGGRRVGSIGAIAAFSFFPSKNLSVAGDGGAVTTNDPVLARKVAMLKDAGREPGAKYEHATVGLNLRMSELQAAIGRVMLKRLPAWVERRRALARLYAQELRDLPNLGLPSEAAGTRHAWHLYVVRHRRRDDLRDHLSRQGIESGVHYPTPCHLQPALRQFAHGALPESERAAREVLSLPVHPLMQDDDVRRVARAVRSFAEAQK